uniref:Uncharacterized protein n=1 Tax=Arundo donax TaxID=35708 RepID=A0A0A9CZB4_ARUDO
MVLTRRKLCLMTSRKLSASDIAAKSHRRRRQFLVVQTGLCKYPHLEASSLFFITFVLVYQEYYIVQDSS